MNSTHPATSFHRLRSPAKIVGLLIGLAAATPGLASPISGLPLRPWHVFVMLAFAISLVFQLKRNRSSVTRFLHLDVAVLLFTAVTLVVEIIDANDLNFTPDYMTVARPLFWLVVYWSARFVLLSVDDAKHFLTWFTVPAFPSVALGFGQVLGIEAVQQLVVKLSPDNGGFAARLEDGRLLRATAFVQHWTSFGSYLCTVVAASVALLILSRANRVGKELYPWTTLCVACLGTVATFTLSSVITAFAIFVFCGKAARAMGRTISVLLLVALIGAVSVGSLISERLDQQFTNTTDDGSLIPATLQYRYRIWQTETVPVIEKRPLTGWGNNVYDITLGAGDPKRIYPIQLVWHSPESQWLNLLVTSGAPGLLGFLLIILLIIKLLVKSHLKGAIWISKPTTTLFILMLIAAFTAPVFTNYGLPIGLWALLAVLSASANSRGSGVK